MAGIFTKLARNRIEGNMLLNVVTVRVIATIITASTIYIIIPPF